MGSGIGYRDLDRGQKVCEGDPNSCKSPSELKNYLNNQGRNEKDRRKYPRFGFDLPIGYRLMNNSKHHGGLVVNMSETGLLIRSIKDIPIGIELKIAVLFPKGFELANFEVLAVVVRKEIHREENWDGYEYGLKFIQISEEYRNILRQVMKGEFHIRCHRCGSVMVYERFYDFHEHFLGWRCILCGEITDQVIFMNRQMKMGGQKRKLKREQYTNV